MGEITHHSPPPNQLREGVAKLRERTVSEYAGSPRSGIGCCPFGVPVVVPLFGVRSDMKSLKQCVAEGLGTFLWCFAGIASMVSTAPPISSRVGWLGIALAPALALTVAIQCFWGLSGAHFNPAVTIALLTTGRIKPGLAVGY